MVFFYLFAITRNCLLLVPPYILLSSLALTIRSISHSLRLLSLPPVPLTPSVPRYESPSAV